MIHVDTIKVSLPLKTKFVIAGGEAEVKTNVLTVLNNRYSGEASGSVAHGPSVEDIEREVQKGVNLLQKKSEVDVKLLSDVNEYEIHPIARSALIGMLLNCISGETKKYPWEVLSLGSPVGIRSSTTVGIDTPAAMLERITSADCGIVKVKLGGEDDMQVVEAFDAIRDRSIRVDANGAWSCEQAEELIYYLAKYGVTIIEQPTDISRIEEWPRLKGKNKNVELIIDEGLNNRGDYIRYVDYIDGVNIKMEKCGGILEGVQIAQRAIKDKKKVMLGCMVESSVGIAQSIYMSSLADYVDLDGPQILETDIASGITYTKDTIEVDREIIGGPKLKREIVERFIED